MVAYHSPSFVIIRHDPLSSTIVRHRQLPPSILVIYHTSPFATTGYRLLSNGHGALPSTIVRYLSLSSDIVRCCSISSVTVQS
uniref:Uncharacterized protein n=1 Tax=Glossina palpalis gambiensis TaxID=67801 RepID=A0A1B0AP13_9MUSC